MALEYYVSAEWGPVDPLTGARNIQAVGNDDSIWWIPGLDCDVPPWPDYLAENPEERTRLEAEAAAAQPPPEPQPEPEGGAS